MVGGSRPVTGGVDTHLHVNVAAVLDRIGGLLGTESFPTSVDGNRRLLKWMQGFGSIAQVGVEGTGSYGAPLDRFLREAGVEVWEVDRPNRQERRRKGKTDIVDAIEAARAAQGQRQLGAAKTKDGNVEAIRALMVARRSARDQKIAALNQIRHVGFTAPEEIRQCLQGVSRWHPGLELTTREADVMALVRHGLTNKQVAGRLYLSTRTVEKHVERILAKTGSANRTALAAVADAGH
jgi:DNA-binding CsgD family transcriptional regulator